MAKFQNKYRIESARANWWNYGWAASYFITICTKNREHFLGTIKNKKSILSSAGLIADVFWHQIPQHFQNVELGAFVVMPNHIHGIIIINNDFETEENQNHGKDKIEDPKIKFSNGGGNEKFIDSDNDIPNNNDLLNDTDGGLLNVPDGGLVNVPDGGGLLNVPDGGGLLNVEERHAFPLPIQTIQPNQQPNQPPNQQPNEPQPPKNQTIGQSRFQNQGKGTLSAIVGSYKSVVTKNANRLEIPFQWQASFHDHIIRDDAEYQRINDYIENNPTKWKDDRFFGL